MEQVLFSSLISNYLIPYLSVEDLCNLIIVSKHFYKVYINISKMQVYNTIDIWNSAYLAEYHTKTDKEKESQATPILPKASVESYYDSLKDDIKTFKEIMMMIRRNGIRDRKPDCYEEREKKTYRYNEYDDDLKIDVPEDVENKVGYTIKTMMTENKKLGDFKFLYLGSLYNI